jgi:hypothetical protein
VTSQRPYRQPQVSSAQPHSSRDWQHAGGYGSHGRQSCGQHDRGIGVAQGERSITTRLSSYVGAGAGAGAGGGATGASAGGAGGVSGAGGGGGGGSSANAAEAHENALATMRPVKSFRIDDPP